MPNKPHTRFYLHTGLALHQLSILITHLGHVNHKHPVALNVNGSSRHDVVRSGLAQRLPRDVALSFKPAQGVSFVLRKGMMQIPVALHVVTHVAPSPLMGCIV